MAIFLSASIRPDGSHDGADLIPLPKIGWEFPKPTPRAQINNAAGA